MSFLSTSWQAAQPSFYIIASAAARSRAASAPPWPTTPRPARSSGPLRCFAL